MQEEYTVGDLIYDANIYDGMNTDLVDLPFYLKWLPKNQEAKILELCCGTGRLTIPIAQAGYDILGVDITPSMLEKAREKASAAQVDIEFIEADIRELDLSEKYDCIFIPFNSIHHLYQTNGLLKTFQLVKKHLKPGGQFLFDCFNPNIRYIVEAEQQEMTIAEYTTEDGRQVTIKQRMRYESASQINRIEWHHFINGEFDSVQKLDMRMYYPQELNTCLAFSGFDIIHKFGTFEEAPFSNQSDKQIFVCR